MPPVDRTPRVMRVVPQQRRAELTVSRILNGALAVVRHAPLRPYSLDEIAADGITIDAIARAANISAPAVYRYFSGVDEILTALVQREQMRILRQGMDILTAREHDSEVSVAGTLVDFFVLAHAELLKTRHVFLFLIRYHHEVSYAGFGAVTPQVRSALGHRPDVSDIQIVTALSGLASAVKAVTLRDPLHLNEPAFRDRMVAMFTSLLQHGAQQPVEREPIAWTYVRDE